MNINFSSHQIWKPVPQLVERAQRVEPIRASASKGKDQMLEEGEGISSMLGDVNERHG